MSDELKPCPFCGELPVFEDYSEEGDGRLTVLECQSSNCHMRVQTSPGAATEKETMIEDWNTRANAEKE